MGDGSGITKCDIRTPDLPNASLHITQDSNGIEKSHL